MTAKTIVAKLKEPDRWIFCGPDGLPVLLPGDVTREEVMAAARLTAGVQRANADVILTLEDGKCLASLTDGRWAAFCDGQERPFLVLPDTVGQERAAYLARNAVTGPGYLLLYVPSKDVLDEPVLAAAPWHDLGTAIRRTAAARRVMQEMECFSLSWLDYGVVWLEKYPNPDSEEEDAFFEREWGIFRGELPEEARCRVEVPEMVTTGDLTF